VNLLQILAAVALNRVVNHQGTVKWSSVNAWIRDNSNPEKINQGYASFNPRPGSGVSSPFVELRKEGTPGKSMKVTATLYFNKRQGASASKTWEGGKLDSELEKVFGKNSRTRIDV